MLIRMMAYYAGAKGGVPFHVREEERRWKEHLKKHKQYIDQSKSTISLKKNTRDYWETHVSSNRAKVQKDILETIDQENQRILNRLQDLKQRYKKRYKKELSNRNKTSSTSYNLSENESIIQDEYEEGAFSGAEENYDDIEYSEDEFELDDDKSIFTNSENESSAQEASEEEMSSRGAKNEAEQKMRDTSQKDTVSHPVTTRPRKSKKEKKLTPAQKANQERIAENIRLNKKLLAIKNGKGRVSVSDPNYDGEERWWITSPRARDRAKMEEEVEKIREEIHKKRAGKLKAREQEEERILKKLQEEEERSKQEKKLPPGYHTKYRKKKKKYPENREVDSVSRSEESYDVDD